MGIPDLERLHPIYRFATDFSKLMEFPFSFKEDSGHLETAIGISETGSLERPLNDSIWDRYKTDWHLFVPDILDYENKIIIEFEEEAKPQKGPKIRKKGHWEESKRDSKRDHYYKLAGFIVLKIWQHQLKHGIWKIMLVQFLIECYQRLQIQTRIKP